MESKTKKRNYWEVRRAAPKTKKETRTNLNALSDTLPVRNNPFAKETFQLNNVFQGGMLNNIIILHEDIIHLPAVSKRMCESIRVYVGSNVIFKTKPIKSMLLSKPKDQIERIDCESAIFRSRSYDIYLFLNESMYSISNLFSNRTFYTRDNVNQTPYRQLQLTEVRPSTQPHQSGFI